MIEASYKKSIENMANIMTFPWHDSSFYAAWLSQTYFYASRSTRLLLMAAAHMEMDLPVLHRRFSAHASEEKGHEVLARRDLEVLGYSLQKIREFPVTKAFYATQFYQVQNESAEILMGWILPLEGLAIENGAQIREIIVKAHPKAPTQFLNVHVDEDPDHLTSAFAALKTLPEGRQQAVIDNMTLTVDMYLKILEECKVQSSQIRLLNAA